jgi:hypothetical protein
LLETPLNVPRYIVPREEDNTDEDDPPYAEDEPARFSGDDGANSSANSLDGSTTISSVNTNLERENNSDSDYEVGKFVCKMPDDPFVIIGGYSGTHHRVQAKDCAYCHRQEEKAASPTDR